MASPLLSLPKLHDRSTPSRVKSEPTRHSVSSYRHGVDRRTDSEPMTYSKRRRAEDETGDVLERGSAPRKDNREPWRKRRRRWSVRGFRRLGLRYMAASIKHILRKAKAFYNELCCDAYNDARSSSQELAVGIDPYFSLPVLTPEASTVSM